MRMDPMPPSPEDFESLRRLLALKRHEKPPPGFFEDFSARVMARIEAEEQMRARSWWDRVSELFQRGRAFAPANLVAASGFVFVGASLFLVLNDRGHAGKTKNGLSVVRETQAAGFLPQPPPTPTWEPFLVLHLAPAPQEPETNEVPKDLFTLPRMRQVHGVQADSPTLLLPPR